MPPTETFPLTVPSPDEVSVDLARREAWDYSLETDPEDRSYAGGVLLPDRSGNGGLAAEIQVLGDNQFELSIHLPDLAAIIPADSNLDLLLRCGTAYRMPVAESIVALIWNRRFGPDQPEWPALSIDIPFSWQESMVTVQAPWVGRSILHRRLTEEPDASLTGKLLRELSADFLTQRLQQGAREPVVDGQVLEYSRRASQFEPLPENMRIKRELLHMAGIALGGWLAQTGQAGMFEYRQPKQPLNYQDYQLAIESLADGTTSSHELYALLAAAQGPHYYSATPVPNPATLNSPYARIGDGRFSYAELVNARVLGAEVNGDRPPYTAAAIAEFITSRLTILSDRDQPATISQQQNVIHGPEVPMSATELAHLAGENFRKAYTGCVDGSVDPELFLEACRLRLRSKGSTSHAMIIDTLFNPEQADELHDVFLMPALLYVANNPGVASNLFHDARNSGRLGPDTIILSSTTNTATIQTPDGTHEFIGRDTDEALTAAMVHLGSDGTFTLDDCLDHPQAPNWTVWRDER